MSVRFIQGVVDMHKLEIKVTPTKLKVRARKEYFAERQPSNP